MRIIKFEWKKLWKAKMYFAMLLLTILLIAGLFIRNVYYQDIIKVERIGGFQEHANFVINQYIGDAKSLSESIGVVDPSLEEAIDTGKVLHEKLQALITAVDEDEYLLALELEITVYELAMQYQSLDRRFALSKIEMEDEIRLNEQLLKKEFPKEELNASIQPAIFMKQVIQLLLNTFGFFIVFMIVGTPVIKEFDDQSFKLSYVLPISSTYMVLSKWISVSISIVNYLMIVLVFSYGISAIFGRKETNPFEYPLFSGEGSFMTAENFLWQSIIWGLLYVLLVIGLFILLTFLLKNTLVVQILLLLLFIVNFIMIQNGFIFTDLPWSYQELNAAILQQQSFSGVGVLLSIFLTGILLFLAIQACKRRGYRA